MTRDEFYQGIVNMSDGEKIKLAHQSMLEILSALKNADFSEEEAIGFLVNLTASFVGADRVVTAREFALFKAITDVNWDFDHFFDVMKGYNPSANDELDRLLDNIGGDFKLACLRYGIAFLAIDDKLDSTELRLFEKFWAD